MTIEATDSEQPSIQPLSPANGSEDGPDFIRELRDLLHKRSMENASNTPDFILAQYLTNCLRAWNHATQQREAWYGLDDGQTSPPNSVKDPNQ